MRLHALAALGAAALLAGCSNPCQDLGDRLCSCVGSGTALDSCKQQVKNQLDAANPGGDVENFCRQKLDTCNVPPRPTNATEDIRFCEWITTSGGKVACGLAFPQTTGPTGSTGPTGLLEPAPEPSPTALENPAAPAASAP